MISRAHPAHNPGNFCAMGRHATPTAIPSPRSEHPHDMRNHTTNCIRARTDRHTIANDPDNLRAMSDHTQGAHTPTATPSPARRGHIPC